MSPLPVRSSPTFGALGIVAVALILLMNTNLSRPAPLPSTETIATTTPETPQVAAATGWKAPLRPPRVKGTCQKGRGQKSSPVRPKIRVASSSPSSTPETGTTTDSSVVRIHSPVSSADPTVKGRVNPSPSHNHARRTPRILATSGMRTVVGVARPPPISVPPVPLRITSATESVRWAKRPVPSRPYGTAPQTPAAPDLCRLLPCRQGTA